MSVYQCLAAHLPFYDQPSVAGEVPCSHATARCLAAGAPTHVPRRKQGWGSEKAEVLLGPEAVCRCETDIYEAIGLAYVPSTMRFFCNFV